MKLGIIPNTKKENIIKVIELLVSKLDLKKVTHFISNSFFETAETSTILNNCRFISNDELFSDSDIIVSIGGDGTVLTTGFLARNSGTPILGINFGKLGFLAEYEIKNLDNLINELLNEEYRIEERITLTGTTDQNIEEEFFAINDIVIDKGKWPKMIELELKVDG